MDNRLLSLLLMFVPWPWPQTIIGFFDCPPLLPLLPAAGVLVSLLQWVDVLWPLLSNISSITMMNWEQQ